MITVPEDRFPVSTPVGPLAGLLNALHSLLNPFGHKKRKPKARKTLRHGDPSLRGREVNLRPRAGSAGSVHRVGRPLEI